MLPQHKPTKLFVVVLRSGDGASKTTFTYDDPTTAYAVRDSYNATGHDAIVVETAK